MKECTNKKHCHGGTGRLIHFGECVECVFEQRDELLRKVEYLVEADKRAHKVADYWHDKYDALLKGKE
jgi:hypothetical protein